MFRLVIDVELGENSAVAVEQAKQILEELCLVQDGYLLELKDKIKYRLQRDEDRRPKNYLEIDENGHASGQKAKLI